MKMNINNKIFLKRFRGLFNKNQPYQIYFGGRGSGKSHNVFLYCVLWMLEGRSILGVRGNSAHIKRSIYSKVVKAIRTLKLTKYFDINKSDLSIVCKISEGSLVTTGVNDPEKVKGVEAVNGPYIDTIIFEEVTELTEEQFTTVYESARGADKGGKFPIRAILLFNPINRNSWLYDRFFKPLEDDYNFNLGREVLYYEDDNLLIHKSTYEDNEYTKTSYEKSFEILKKRNPRKYNVNALGNFGVLGDLVYENIKVITKTTLLEMIRDRSQWKVRLGMDFGFNDPITLSVSLYNSKTGQSIIIDEYSERKIADMNKLGETIKKILIKNEIKPTTLIYGDSASPTTIEMLRRQGLNVIGNKPKDKMDSIRWLQDKEILVLDSCKKTISSFSIYSYKKDKQGITIDDVNHDGSDILDAYRYSYTDDMKYGGARLGTYKA